MSASNIVCPSCGKEYTWQAQLAGHTVRCTCGQVMPVPAVAAETDSVYALAPTEDTQFARAASGGISLMDSEDAGLPCPSCGQTIEFGGVLCKFCGYNVKTGLHDPRAIVALPAAAHTMAVVRDSLDAAPAAHAPPAAPMIVQQFGVPTPAPRKEVAQETRQEILKRYLSILGAILGLILMVGVVKALLSPSVPKGMTADDAAIATKLQSELTLEPLRWLDMDPQRQLGRFNRPQAKEWIEEIYRNGAKKMYCYGQRGTPEIYAEPPSPAAVDDRAKFFRWYEEYCGTVGVSAFPDAGQKYVRIEIPK